MCGSHKSRKKSLKTPILGFKVVEDHRCSGSSEQCMSCELRPERSESAAAGVVNITSDGRTMLLLKSPRRLCSRRRQLNVIAQG